MLESVHTTGCAGALFLGERTFDSGAVGCLLAGPIQASTVSLEAVAFTALHALQPV